MKLYERLTDIRAKKKDKKGFTLVELIVVLVILAILAAIAVPALLGYIDKAKESQYSTEASSIMEAAQVVVTEAYAASTNGEITFTDGTTVGNFSAEQNKEVQKMTDLTDLTITGIKLKAQGNEPAGTSGRGSISEMIATWKSANGDNVKGTLANNNWTFEKIK